MCDCTCVDRGGPLLGGRSEGREITSGLLGNWGTEVLLYLVEYWGVRPVKPCPCLALACLPSNTTWPPLSVCGVIWLLGHLDWNSVAEAD